MKDRRVIGGLTYCALFFLFFWLIPSTIKYFQQPKPPSEYEIIATGGYWTVSTARYDRHGYFVDCDATDDYIYFAYYYGNEFHVDTYDNDGNFLYLISIVDHAEIGKGKGSIRCDGNQLYVDPRLSRYYYVFEGTSMIRMVNSSTFIVDEGHRGWFKTKNKNLSIDDSYIYRLDEEGNVLSKIPKPEQVKQKPSLSFGPVGDQIVYWIVVGLLLFVFCWFIVFFVRKAIEEKKENKKGPPHHFTRY